MLDQSYSSMLDMNCFENRTEDPISSSQSYGSSLKWYLHHFASQSTMLQVIVSNHQSLSTLNHVQLTRSSMLQTLSLQQVHQLSQSKFKSPKF